MCISIQHIMHHHAIFELERKLMQEKHKRKQHIQSLFEHKFCATLDNMFSMHCSIRVTTLQPFHIDDKMHLRRCLLDYLAIFSMCFWSGFRCVFISWTFISQYSFLSYQNMVLKAIRCLGYALAPRRQGITRPLLPWRCLKNNTRTCFGVYSIRL